MHYCPNCGEDGMESECINCNENICEACEYWVRKHGPFCRKCAIEEKKDVEAESR